MNYHGETVEAIRCYGEGGNPCSTALRPLLAEVLHGFGDTAAELTGAVERLALPRAAVLGLDGPLTLAELGESAAAPADPAPLRAKHSIFAQLKAAETLLGLIAK